MRSCTGDTGSMNTDGRQDMPYKSDTKLVSITEQYTIVHIKPEPKVAARPSCAPTTIELPADTVSKVTVRSGDHHADERCN